MTPTERTREYDWLTETPRTDDQGVARLQVKLGKIHCSFCVATISKAVSRLDGVQQVSVSLAHEEGMVAYRPDQITASQVVSTLREIGYSVRDPRKVGAYDAEEAELADERNRFLAGLGTTAVTLVLMIAMWTGTPLTVTLAGAEWRIGAWAVLGLALAMMFVVARPILVMAYQSLRRGILNQHVLLEAGAFGGLAGALLGLLVAPDAFPAMEFASVTVFITTYHLLSGYASALVRTKSSRAVRALLVMLPDTAIVIRDGAEVEVPVRDVGLGELVRVRPGQRLPLDGRVVSGHSAVDESMVTGEPIPSTKGEGGEVIGGSLNQTGTLTIEVSRVGEDTFLAQVARQIEQARALKPSIIVLVDRILAVYVPVVLTVAALALLMSTGGAWAIGVGVDAETAIFSALAVLVMGYPCALGMATPLAMIRGGGRAAEQGILMRSGEAFQVFGRVTYAALDKTGTLTAGKPAVTAVVPARGVPEAELLATAAAVEAASEHPLGRSIVDAAGKNGLDIPGAERFEGVTGYGVTATVAGSTVSVGKPEWAAPASRLGELVSQRASMEQAAHTVVAVAADGRLLGMLGIADEIKPDAATAVTRLREAGITPVMLTGDNPRTAQAVAEQVGIADYRAGLLPEDKAEAIRDLQQDGRRVLMVGDGINDAPALAQADVGIAIGAGTDIAIESSDVVLVGDRLSAVADARDIAVESFGKTKQNLAVAFAFNGIGVPLAVTGLVGPTWAMIAMIASVSAVLANSFGARLRPSSLRQFGRWLAGQAKATVKSAGSGALRSLALQRESAAYGITLCAALVVGALWTLLGSPTAF